MRIALAQINPIIGNLAYNLKKILSSIEEARHRGATLVVFPEMALLGYPPEDLLCQPAFIQAVTHSLEKIIEASKDIGVIVGTVRENLSGGEKSLFNSAAVICNRKLVGFQDKTLLPDYDVFSERRYFEPSAQTNVWSLFGKRVAITICEDIWQHADAVEYSHYPRDPVIELKEQAPDILINLSASPYYMRRLETRLKVCTKAASTLSCPVLFCNQVGGNDSLIFDGASLFVGKNGKLLGRANAFREDLFIVDPASTKEEAMPPSSSLEELYQALVLGIRDYFHKLGFSKACLGLSGGIDSAIVACLAKEALGKENVLGLLLPSRYTSPESLRDAKELAKKLGIKTKELSIEKPYQAFLDLLAPEFEGKKPDITEENLQARIRGMILMAFSNKWGYLVLSTGNKSEMAMGYMTLYGDMCGGLAVLSDVSKEYIYHLASYINLSGPLIPESIILKPPSAELRPNQKDSDSLPDYSIVDYVLNQYVEEHRSKEEIAEEGNLSLELVSSLVQKIHQSEYKRRQAPPGLRVTKKSFSIGRRFPIVQHWNVTPPQSIGE